MYCTELILVKTVNVNKLKCFQTFFVSEIYELRKIHGELS